MPMNCAIKPRLPLYCTVAITTDMRINTTIRSRMHKSCVLSFMSFIKAPFIKSRVRVEAEAITREERVDIEADKTSIITTPIRTGDRPESMEGIMESKPLSLTCAPVVNSLPKPPRK